MATLLIRIQDFCQELIEKFSAVYNLNIEVIDNELRYVAAVGRYSDRINELMPPNGGRLTIKVLSSKEQIYVTDPQTHPICSECYNLINCKDQVEICYPIICKDKSLGVISIASAGQQQAEMIKENYDRLILSVSLMADLIQEHVENYSLYQEFSMQTDMNILCLNAMPDGAMILKNDNRIIQMNLRCEKILGYSIAQIPYLEKINQIKISIQNLQENNRAECYIKIRGKEMILTGQLSLLSGENTSISLFAFGDISVPQDPQYPLFQQETYKFESFIGRNPAFLSALEESKSHSFSGNCILISGEAGVGKARLARTIHHESSRKNNKFIRISGNNDFAEILCRPFGPAASADASEIHCHIYEDAVKGNTIFFDEVGALSHYNQEKLLSLLRNANYMNCKIICSTTCDLKKLVNKGDFIKDLYFALELNTIHLPPLRSRTEDVILLAEHYLKRYNLLHKKNLSFSKGILDSFLNYSWRGNLIELENTIAFIVEAHDDIEEKITTDNIPVQLRNRLREESRRSFNLEEAEKEMIVKALNEFGSIAKSKKIVAKSLGISVATLYRKLKYYNILHNSNYD